MIAVPDSAPIAVPCGSSVGVKGYMASFERRLQRELPKGLSTEIMMLIHSARLSADAVADYVADGGGEGGEILIRESAEQLVREGEHSLIGR